MKKRKRARLESQGWRVGSAEVHWREVGRPLLVIEILSSSTAARDRGLKRRIYQQAGIPEYWIVDLDARLVERWRPEDARPEILRETLPWRPPGSSIAFEVDLADFFSGVPIADDVFTAAIREDR